MMNLMNLRRQGVLLFLSLALIGCAGGPEVTGRVVTASGFNKVLLVPEGESQPNSHPVTLTPAEIGTLLHRMLYSERRTFLTRLAIGEANQRRVFRSNDIDFLAPALSKALAQATPRERVYFHLSHPGKLARHGDPAKVAGLPGGSPMAISRGGGGEETTTGWIFVRGLLLYLVMSEVQYSHPPAGDIGLFIRQFSSVQSGPSGVTLEFDPETYMASESSWGDWTAAIPLEIMTLRFRDALADLPPYKILEGGEPVSP